MAVDRITCNTEENLIHFYKTDAASLWCYLLVTYTPQFLVDIRCLVIQSSSNRGPLTMLCTHIFILTANPPMTQTTIGGSIQNDYESAKSVCQSVNASKYLR